MLRLIYCRIKFTMSFIKTNKVKEDLSSPMTKKPFYKKRSWRVFFLILGVCGICLVSLVAYVYATGSKVFDNGFGSGSIAKAIKGEKLNGEDEGRVNILFLGRGGEGHPGGLLTDSLMVMSLNTKDKKMATFSIPRDLYVPIKGYGSAKINEAYKAGYDDYIKNSCKKKNKNDCKNDASAAGSALTSETISNILGIPIQYYVMADFEGFKQLVDKVGGIDVNVEKAIYDSSYPADDMIHYSPFKISAGQHHMNGDIALKYARSRHGSAGGDFDRAKRQQQIISAIKEKASASGVLANPKKILDIVNIIGNHVRTNFSPSEIKVLADRIKDVSQGGITSGVISNGEGGLLISDSSSGTYYLKPKGGNFDQVKIYAKSIFDDTQKTNEKPKIEVLNGSKTAGLASKAAEKIEKAGYTVTKIDVSATKTAKTVIYDYSGGKQKSVTDYLKKELNAEVVAKTVDSSRSANISVIIGDNYLN